MIIVDVPRHGVAAIDDDDGCAAYESVTVLGMSQACRDGGAPVELRLVVEVLRRCGGMAPRALLGGRFVAGEGDATTYVVHRGIPWAEGPGPPCPSRLWNRPYLVGLPEEYAGAALEGVAADAGPLLPAGVFTVDRAAHDVVESSQFAFRLAGSLLRHVMAARIEGTAVDVAARSLMSAW